MSDIQFGRPPAHRQMHHPGRLDGKASRPSLLDRLGASENTRGGVERDAGPTGGSRKRGPSHHNVAGMFNNSRRSSVVRIRPGKQAKQTYFAESQFFAATDQELEGEKENRQADPPSSGRIRPSMKAFSTHPSDDFVTPEHAATLIAGPKVFDFGLEEEREKEEDEQGEEEEEEENRWERDVLPEEMSSHQRSISGKLLERQQLIQQIVASCMGTTGLTQVEIEAEKAAAASYIRCRKISDSRQGPKPAEYCTDRRVSDEFSDAARGSKQAMACLQDFYESASPEKFDRRRGQVAPQSGPDTVQRLSAENSAVHTSPTPLASEPRPPMRRNSHVVRNMSAQQIQGSWQQARALGMPERASPAALVRIGGRKGMPPRQISPASPAGMFSGQCALLGPPGMLSADETIAQSMMLPEAVTP